MIRKNLLLICFLLSFWITTSLELESETVVEIGAEETALPKPLPPPTTTKPVVIIPYNLLKNGDFEAALSGNDWLTKDSSISWGLASNFNSNLKTGNAVVLKNGDELYQNYKYSTTKGDGILELRLQYALPTGEAVSSKKAASVYIGKIEVANLRPKNNSVHLLNVYVPYNSTVDSTKLSIKAEADSKIVLYNISIYNNTYFSQCIDLIR